MPLTAYRFDPELAGRYLDLCFEIYRDDPNWIPPVRNRVLRQFAPDFAFHRKTGSAHRNFLATANGKPVGHATALLNAGLRDRDGTPVGAVGFFECIDDPALATELLGAATGWLHAEHGLRRIWGPMQFDIWHGYRLMTRGFGAASFFGEPYNKRYYPAFFASGGFEIRKHWHSVEISGAAALQARLAPWADDYARAVAGGYRFAPIDVRSATHVQALHAVIDDAYRHFLGMTRLDRGEFSDVFGAFAEGLNPRFAIGAWTGRGTLAGFAIAYPDYARALQAMQGRDSLFGKLRFYLRARGTRRAVFFMIGISAAASERRRGLGRALFHAELRALLAAGFDSVVFALLAEDSPAWHFLSDCRGKAQKEYALYEANLER